MLVDRCIVVKHDLLKNAFGSATVLMDLIADTTGTRGRVSSHQVARQLFRSPILVGKLNRGLATWHELTCSVVCLCD